MKKVFCTKSHSKTKGIKKFQNILAGNQTLSLGEGKLAHRKTKGFTLAEVLITLGIIGVVAAMTIPTLIAKTQKNQTATKLQKAISVLNQAYKMSYAENGEIDANEQMELGSEQYFKEYWAPYIKVNQFCSSASNCGYASSFPIYKQNGAGAGWYWGSNQLRTLFSTMDGFTYLIVSSYYNDAKGQQVSEALIWVDINGPSKPNRYGRDVFELVAISNGGGISPYGYNLTDKEVENKCSSSSSSADESTCAERIKRAGWKIDSNYPWKI